MYDRAITRLVEKNCRAHRLFTTPLTAPTTPPTTPAAPHPEPAPEAEQSRLPVILVIDEAAALAHSNPAIQDATRALIAQILQRGRSVGLLHPLRPTTTSDGPAGKAGA